VKLKKNLNAVASSLHLSLSRLPDAFQKFTKFYQFRGGYHSSLGAPLLIFIQEARVILSYAPN
jgi:hypothetical protein